MRTRLFAPVLRLLGLLIVFFASTMLLPIAVSLWFGDSMWRVHLLSSLITACCGAAIWLATRNAIQELQPRHGILLVVLTWCAMPFFATLPLVLGHEALGRPLRFSLAFYEATSGLSTSGGTALAGIDTLPVSINFWRCFLQWQGGMGILVLVVAVLPMLGMGGSQLFRAETAGPMKENKLTPRIAETAKGLWYVYATLSLACALAYWAAGMTPIDAIMHMFTTIALGGTSSHEASFAYFNSFAIECVAVVFMLAASCNFALYFSAIYKKDSSILWRNPELRWTLFILIGGGVLVSLVIWWEGHFEFWDAMRKGIFHTISIATTTGYATTDYEKWPVFAPVFMLLLSSFATSAGSTGGGCKTIRFMVLFQQIRQELNRMVHPRAVQPAHIGALALPPNVVRAVVAYTVLYSVTLVTMILVLLLTELDFYSAFGAVIASLNCVGTGLGKVGTQSSYAALTDFQVSVCSLAMILGRLELLSFFALLMPSFWRR